MASDKTTAGGGQGQIVMQQGFFRVARTCDGCGGSGQAIKRACGTCRGSGRLETVQQLSVRIPAGVDSGVRLRLSGEGEADWLTRHAVSGRGEPSSSARNCSIAARAPTRISAIQAIA